MNFKRIAKMIDPSGFDEVFEREISNHDTYKKAFLKLNKEFKEATNRKRYSNYESYRKAREKRIRS